jgi:ABC-type branched-subunit amino acid transport system substrate-binding protein
MHPQYVRDIHIIRTLLTVFAVMSTGLASAQVPGVTAKSILLGQSAAFSGPAAQLGIQMNLGTKAYFDSVNAQGGVYGRKIELKTRDDRYEATLCVENTKKFIEEDKVFALIS